jgi:hypothetical protein
MADAMREFESIADYLGRREIGQAVDIGCGHAFIDLPLWRRYSCRIHLVDIEKTAARYHDWNASGAGYASLASAKQLLVTNGVPPDVIETTNPEMVPLNLAPQSCDLMMSLLSAGFHYPVDGYATIAREALKPGGVFIFDARKTQRQEEVVADFSRVDIIAEGARHHRLAAVR